MTASLRRSIPVLLGVTAGAGALWIIGPTLQGAAAALLCVGGAAGLQLSGRSPPSEPCLRLVGRLRVAPRIELMVVETQGRRFLVASGATVTVLPPGDDG